MVKLMLKIMQKTNQKREILKAIKRKRPDYLKRATTGLMTDNWLNKNTTKNRTKRYYI